MKHLIKFLTFFVACVSIAHAQPAPQKTATEQTLSSFRSDFTSRVPVTGQTTMSSSFPVVIASNQSAVPVSQSGNWQCKIQDSSGNSLTSTGGALDVNVVSGGGGGIGGGTVDQGSAGSDPWVVTGDVHITSGIDEIGYVKNSGTFAVQATQSGTWNVNAAQSGTWNTNAVQSGTWNINNVSGTVSLPTGAATAAKQPALGTAGTPSADVITVQGTASMTALKVDGSAFTQPVSGTVSISAGTAEIGNVKNSGTFAVQAAQSGTWNINNISGTVSLPTGAATAAKQPALGVSGNASTDVLTVQGITGMTALKVDGSAVTQPVSGTVTTSPPSNASTNITQIASNSVSVGNGVSGTGVQRVTIASDSTGQVALAAGTAEIGNVKNSGTFAVQAAQSGTWNINNISGTVSLPTGAATAAKQPALGTAGTPSADVITVQGTASMTALKVDGSAVTQPVSGTVTTSPPSNASTNISQIGGNTISAGNGVSGTGVQRVTIASDSTGQVALAAGVAEIGNVKNSGTFAVQAAQSGTWNITNISGTVSLPTGAATAAKQPALGTAGTPSADVITVQGTASMTALKVDGSAVTQPVSGTLTVNGGVAHDGVDSGNPVKTGARAVSSMPTAVSAADRTDNVSDLYGRQLVSHIDPAAKVWKSFNATTTQTGTGMWTPAAGKKIAVTSLVISTYGTTACRILVWFGASADTTYTAGTDQLLTPMSTAPSTTSKPGMVYSPSVPSFCNNADYLLRVTTDAACSLDIIAEGYEY